MSLTSHLLVYNFVPSSRVSQSSVVFTILFSLNPNSSQDAQIPKIISEKGKSVTNNEGVFWRMKTSAEVLWPSRTWRL